MIAFIYIFVWKTLIGENIRFLFKNLISCKYSIENQKLRSIYKARCLNEKKNFLKILFDLGLLVFTYFILSV